jgi:PKD repeat protein
MTDRRKRWLALVTGTLVVLGTVSLVVGVGVAGATEAGGATSLQADDEDTTSFTVSQGGDCIDVTPLGDGTETVVDFYNYSTANSFSSGGTTHLQDNQVSNLFVYHGSGGYSLVFLHDAYEGPYGGTVSMTITDLPATGSWVVEDDDYPGRDDEYRHAGTRSDIDWMWGEGRTDGGAFRGLGETDGAPVTVEPGFNEAGDAWGEWNETGGNHTIDTWRVLTDDGTTVTTLDLDAPVTVEAGRCEPAAPTVSLAADPTSASVGRAVTFSAALADHDATVREYRWDVDGDGVVDERTTRPTLVHTYSAGGTYEVTVTVEDEAGRTGTATETVGVGAVETEAAPADSTVEPRVESTPSSDASAPGLVTAHLWVAVALVAAVLFVWWRS